jgi:hypothetical protein
MRNHSRIPFYYVRDAEVCDMAELDPETNTLRSSATKVLRKRYMWLLGIVGLPTIGDLVREYARGKAMDYAASQLGVFGDFLVANPFALSSIGIIVAMVVLMVMVVSESIKDPSVGHYNNAKAAG